jgi:hypothetical protein
VRKPRKDDLTPWAVRQMETAYQERERPQCSREDFEAGYFQALLDNHVRSAFLVDRRAEVFGHE